jgi:Peptidase inhibitor family I36
METKHARRASRFAVPLLIVAALIAVDSPANAGSRSDCPSGYFCVWTLTYYDGTRYQFNDVDDYNRIYADPIRSAYNHRSKRTYLNELSGSSSNYSCFGAGDYDGSLSGWQLHANSAFLSTYTYC